MNVKELDRKLIKQSDIRIIKCGQIVEIYKYAIPYFYNFGTTKLSLREKENFIDKIRTDNLDRARRTIKRLVNSNVFAYGYHPIFITYTFAGNVTDIKEANRALKKFHRRLAETLVGRRLRYLAVPEIQGKRLLKYGVAVWHFHAIYFDLPYIDGIKAIFASKWAEGFVQVKAIEHVRNVGAYVSKYFGKEWAEARHKHNKNYYTSENLYQPEVYHSLDILEQFGTMIEEHSQEYLSDKYGVINYQQLKITNSHAKCYSHFSQSRITPVYQKDG